MSCCCFVILFYRCCVALYALCFVVRVFRRCFVVASSLFALVDIVAVVCHCSLFASPRFAVVALLHDVVVAVVVCRCFADVFLLCFVVVCVFVAVVLLPLLPQRALYRTVLMLVFHWCVSFLCTREIKDTQCGEVKQGRDPPLSSLGMAWHTIPYHTSSSS